MNLKAMTTKFVIDSYAWMEYLDGSEKGRILSKLFNNKDNELFTNIVTFSEVISVVKRRHSDLGIAENAMLTLSNIYNCDLLLYKEVGILHGEIKKNIKDFGLADAFVLQTARKLQAKVVTGDPHFKSFKNKVIFLK